MWNLKSQNKQTKQNENRLTETETRRERYGGEGKAVYDKGEGGHSQ